MIVNSEGNSTLYVDFLGAAVTSPDLIIIFIYNINLLDASITPGHIRSLLLLDTVLYKCYDQLETDITAEHLGIESLHFM